MVCNVISSFDYFEWPLGMINCVFIQAYLVFSAYDFLFVFFYFFFCVFMKSLLLFPLVNIILLRQTWETNITISCTTTVICLWPHPETHKTPIGCPKILFSCQTLLMPMQDSKNCHPLNQNPRRNRTQALRKLKPHLRVELPKSQVKVRENLIRNVV